MMDLGETSSIRAWYDFLTEECGLKIGQDWKWAWRNNRWHVEFMDDRIESLVRLKAQNDS
jgi:hypothetical protein